MLLLRQRSIFADSDLSAWRKPSLDGDIVLLPPPSSWDTSPKTILLFTSTCQHFTSALGVDDAEYSHRQGFQQPGERISTDLEGNVLFWETATFPLLGSHFRAGVMMCWEHFMNFQFTSPSSVLRILCWTSSFFFFCCYFSALYSAAQKTAQHLLPQWCSIECSSWTPDNHCCLLQVWFP